MAKWNMIPSAEGPFKGLDANGPVLLGLLYDPLQTLGTLG